MKRLSFILLLMIAVTSPLPAAQEPNFDDMFDSADEEFKKMKRKADDEFSRMKESVDDEFGALLDNAWREFELARGIVRDETPKPDTPPVARHPEAPERPAPLADKPPRKTPHPEPPAVTPPPPPEIPVPLPETRRPGKTLAFDFYHTGITLEIDSRWQTNLTGGKVSSETVSRYWNLMSRTDYEPFLRQAAHVRESMKLNDWGYCRMLHAFASKLYPRPSNERPLFIWFMLVKSGYDARVGFSADTVFVLVPSAQTIFQAPFYEMGTEKYYITNLGGSDQPVKSLYTYDGRHEQAVKRIDFSMLASPVIGRNPLRKTFTFLYDGEHRITVNINRTIVDFYEYYPQIDLDVYFNAPMSSETDNTLIEGLRPIIEGKSEPEAANIILRFVQTALEYQTDGEQFQYENYLFPEETLYYPYCDCEDRSFLYGYLVGTMLGLDVVGLEYPGHVATAVRFNGDVSGDTLLIDGGRYVICDPTFINANIGECMPKYKNVLPTVIEIQRLR